MGVGGRGDRLYDGGGYRGRRQVPRGVVPIAFPGDDLALHIGVDPTRVDRGDTQFRLLGAHPVSEGAQREFACGIRGPARAYLLASPRVQEDDVAAANA